MGFEDLSHWNGHRIDWGNVPAWIGSLLTALTLMVTLYIILRDRNEASKAQARRVSFTVKDWGNDRACLIVNSSDAAITQVRILMRSERTQGKVVPYLNFTEQIGTIETKKTHQADFPDYNTFTQPEMELRFFDINGRCWALTPNLRLERRRRTEKSVRKALR